MTTPSDRFPPLQTSNPAELETEHQQQTHPHRLPQDVSSSHSNSPENQRPSSPPSNVPTFQYHASLHPLDASDVPTLVTHRASPLSAELRLQIDSAREQNIGAGSSGGGKDTHPEYRQSIAALPVRSSSVKSLTTSYRSVGALSPASVASSPGVGPLSDITPLPSPIGASPSPWSRMPLLDDEDQSAAEKSLGSPTMLPFPDASPPRKRKAHVEKLPPSMHQVVNLSTITAHNRNRSLSEYVPQSAPNRTRNIAVSGSQTPTSTEPSVQPMQREEYLAVQRGISALPTPRPPTPPRSNRSATDSSESGSPPFGPQRKEPSLPRYEAKVMSNGKTRHWTAVRQLGKGTFSRVMLATSDDSSIGKREDDINRKSLVAVKVCEHGPAGGADEKKIESSLKRELEILKKINHPSLVHLKAVNILEKRAYLVLNYCPGGDMFELASLKLSSLVPSFVRRIFAELIGAVRYLHGLYIVHRDIKLESKPP